MATHRGFFDQHCVYCGGVAWTLDHFQSLADGGGSTHSNCVPSCYSCNAAKALSSPGNLTPSFVSIERLVVIRDYREAESGTVVAQQTRERVLQELEKPSTIGGTSHFSNAVLGRLARVDGRNSKLL